MGENLIGKFNYANNNFSITKNEEGIIRYWIEKNGILKAIEEEAHRKIVKEVIKNLNDIRYMLIGNVKYKEESYLWYVNSYIPQSIFVNKNTREICEYEENKELYEKYNFNPSIVYISENTKKYFKESIKPKAKVIKITVLGVITSIMLTASGAEFLSRNNLDENYPSNKQEAIKLTDIEDTKIGITDEEISNAILNNDHLEQEEKEFIIENFKEFFKDAKQYMDAEKTVDILETLKMKYEYDETQIAMGTYNLDDNVITYHCGNNLEEVINYSKIVPIHEIFHALQSFRFGEIYEGMTQEYAEEYGRIDMQGVYPNEKLWAKILLEVFGRELILRDSLNDGLLQYIPEKIAELSEDTTFNSAEVDLINLISDINDSIEYLNKERLYEFLKDSHDNEEEEKKIESIFTRLEDYDKLLNGRETNKMIEIYRDAMLKTNDSEILENNGEYIYEIKKNYFTNTQDIKIQIRNNKGGYECERKDENGNVIQRGKIPFRNVIIDIDGILYLEDPDKTMQDFIEEYGSTQEENER